MTREHKYRAWDIADDRLCKVDEIDFIDGSIHVSWYVDDTHQGHYLLHRGEYVLEEFTGFLDKNGKGKECYENDSMQLTHICLEDCCLTHIVMSEKGQWSLEYEGRIICSLWDGIYQHSGEVIGNIHSPAEGEQP